MRPLSPSSPFQTRSVISCQLNDFNDLIGMVINRVISGFKPDGSPMLINAFKRPLFDISCGEIFPEIRIFSIELSSSQNCRWCLPTTSFNEYPRQLRKFCSLPAQCRPLKNQSQPETYPTPSITLDFFLVQLARSSHGKQL